MVRFVRVVVGPHFIDIQLHLWVLFKQLQKMIHASIRPSAVLSLPGLISIPNSLIDSYWIITKGLKAEICRMGFQCSEKRLNGLLRVECFLSRAVSSRVTRGQETLRVRRNQKKTQTAAGSTVTKKRANALRASDRFVFFLLLFFLLPRRHRRIFRRRSASHRFAATERPGGAANGSVSLPCWHGIVCWRRYLNCGAGFLVTTTDAPVVDR